jgi:hypothetical protein
LRAISKATAFKRTLVHAQTTLINTPNGPERITTQQPYIAHFQQGGATAYEKQLAQERFKFTGTGDGENPLKRISIFDTDEAARSENWTPEFKAEAEASLLAGQGEFYFVAEAKKAEKPWPAYDTADVEQIVGLAGAFGVSLEHVLLYEQENQKRPAVIAELEAAQADTEEVEISA